MQPLSGEEEEGVFCSDMTECAVRENAEENDAEKHVGINSVWASCDKSLNTAVQTRYKHTFRAACKDGINSLGISSRGCWSQPLEFCAVSDAAQKKREKKSKIKTRTKFITDILILCLYHQPNLVPIALKTEAKRKRTKSLKCKNMHKTEQLKLPQHQFR